MISFWHSLGFHGANWEPFWLQGNVWVECTVCGARRLPPFEDMAEMPAGAHIAPQSRFPRETDAL